MGLRTVRLIYFHSLCAGLQQDGTDVQIILIAALYITVKSVFKGRSEEQTF